MTDRCCARSNARTCASSATPPAACCCSAIRFRSISNASSTEPCSRGVWLEINASPERLDLAAR